MKILTQQLCDGFPKSVHEEYNPKDLGLEFVDLVYSKRLVLDGTVEKCRNTLTFRGRLTSRVKHTCARCLKQVEDPVDQPFELVYDIAGRDEVDTLDDLREILILDHPIQFVCREECPGLCPSCGADLNEGPCSCSHVST